MREIREFSRRAAIYLFSNVAGAALPFLLLPFLVRELGPAEYGRIGLLASAFALLLTLVGLGTHAFVRTSYTRSTEQELKQILGNAIVVVLVAAILMLLLLYGLGQFLAFPIAFGYVVIAVCAAFGQKLISIQLVLWQMAGRPSPYGLLSVGMTALNLALSLLLVFTFQMQAEGRLLGMWLPAAVVGPLALLYMLRRDGVEFTLSRVLLRKILAFGIPLIPHGIALSLVVFAERAALSASFNLEALGIFFAAFQLALPVSILASSINLQFRSWSDRAMTAGEHLKVVRASYLIILVLAFAALSYGWLLQFVYDAIVGGQMVGGYPVCLILVGSAFFRGCYLVVVKGLFFSGQTAILMQITVTLTVVLCSCLFFVHDLYAVAFLDLAFNSLLFLVVWLAAARKYPQPWLAFATKSRSTDL